MSLPSRLSLGSAILALAAGAFLAVSPPASADATNTFSCESGSLKVLCTLDGTASQEVWTFNGSHLSSKDGASSIFVSCGTENTVYRVSVTFLDSAGVLNTRSNQGTCRRVWQ
jgi:hypothetical protein